VTIAIDNIRVDTRLRRLDRAHLKFIADSISKIGLKTPIHIAKVDDRYRLVAGFHRLEACRQLGHQEIAAVVVDMDDITRQIWEIDENLARAELTAAEEAIHLARRKELYELKGGKILATPGGVQNVGFAKDAAEQIGRSKQGIHAAIARAERIPDIQLLVNTSLDKGVELDALAKLPEAEQSALIEAATAGKKVSARSPKAPKPPAERRQEKVQPPVEAVAASADDDGVDKVEGAGSAADGPQDKAQVEVGADDLVGKGQGRRVDGEIDLIDSIAATVEKLASDVERLDDAGVEKLDATVRRLTEIKHRRAPSAKPKAEGEVEPEGGYETDFQLSLALKKAFKEAAPRARRWSFNDMRDDLRLWLTAEGYELGQKKPEGEATDATPVDQVVEPTDSSTAVANDLGQAAAAEDTPTTRRGP
jgi:hypothetical protein